MAKKPDLRKHFEAILGREIADLSDGVIQLREFTGLASIEEGNGTSREIGTTGFSTKACSASKMLCIGGLVATGIDGKVEFLLSDFHCLKPGAVKHPIIFVATAQSQDPVFVTTRTFEVSKEGKSIPTDVRIEIYTWEPGGAPAGSKLVKWFCRFLFVDPLF